MESDQALKMTLARMMMVCIYNMISLGEPFNPCDYEELMNPSWHSLVFLSYCHLKLLFY